MKKKVVITGISSLIMQKLCDLIDLSEYEIVGLSRQASALSQNGILIIKADINNPEGYEHQLKDCDLIIHAAAATHSFKESKYYQVNVEATKTLVDKAKEYNIKKFIYLSSNTASENSGAYAQSKLLAENYIQENLKHWLILRPSEFYGEGCKEGIERLIDKAVNKPIVICPNGMPYSFSPIYINDAAQMIFETIFVKSFKNEIKIVNGNKKITFKEILELVKKYKNNRLRVININKKTMFLIMNIAKRLPFKLGVIPDQIERLYGFKSYGMSTDYYTTSIEDYIKKIIT